MASTTVLTGPPALTSIVESLCRLLSFPVSTKPSSHVTLTKPSKRFSGVTEDAVVKGLANVALHLSTHCTMSVNLTAGPTAESWCRSACGSLVPLLSGKSLDAYRSSVVADFAARLDSHMQKHTYLGSDHGSYADVVVCGLLAALLKKGASLEGQNAVRWYNTCGAQLGYDAVVLGKEEKGKGKDKGDAKGKKKEKAKADGEKTPAPAPAPAPAAGGAAAADLPAVDPSSADYTSNALLSHLASLSIPSTTHSHAAAFTSDELSAAAGSLGQHTKNIFLKDKKHGLFLVTARPDADTNTKALAKR